MPKSSQGPETAPGTSARRDAYRDTRGSRTGAAHAKAGVLGPQEPVGCLQGCWFGSLAPRVGSRLPSEPAGPLAGPLCVSLSVFGALPGAGGSGGRWAPQCSGRPGPGL